MAQARKYALNPAQISLLTSHDTAFLTKDGQEINQLNFYFLVKEDCDLAALERAYFQLFQYNPSLNLKYQFGIGGYKQYLPKAQARKPLEVIEFQTMDEFEHFVSVESYSYQVKVLGRNPIWACLAKIGSAGAVVVRASHLLLDGYSLSLVFSQLEGAYLAFEQNEPAPACRTGSVIDAFEKYEEYKHSDDREQDKQFWKSMHNSFSQLQAVVPYKRNERTKLVSCPIGGEAYQGVKQLSDSSMMSVEFIMQYLTALLIYKLTGKKCFAFLSLTHGRRNLVLKRTVGCLYEDIILYFDFEDDEDFMVSLKRHYARYMECLVHGRLPITDHIYLSAGNFARTKNLQQYSWMIFSNMGYVNAVSNPRFRTGTMPPTNQTWHLFVGMFDVAAKEEILFQVEYAVGLYTPEQISGYADKLEEIIDFFLKDLNRPIGKINSI